MFRKKIPSDDLFLHFFFESSESDRVFNFLHDSNSIFRARGINSEWVPGCAALNFPRERVICSGRWKSGEKDKVTNNEEK